MINPFELIKKRVLRFMPEPADQVEGALMILSGLSGLQVVRTSEPHCLEIHYNLCDYTLAGLEHALEQEGFLLKHGLLHHLGRYLVYYCEDTARHNMEIRGHVTKKNEKEVFIGVHEQHVRPDLAGKSPELREYE